MNICAKNVLNFIFIALVSYPCISLENQTLTPTTTPCDTLVSANSQKLFRLIQIWLNSPENSADQKSLFIKNLLPMKTPTNPFQGWETPISAQLEKATDLILPVSDDEWDELMTLIEEETSTKNERDREIKVIDEVTSNSVGIQVEAELPSNGRPFLKTPHWVNTPSGKSYAFATRATGNQPSSTLEFHFYEYNPNGGRFHFINKIGSIVPYLPKWEYKITPLPQAIDDDTVVIDLEYLRDGKHVLLEVNLKNDSTKVLAKFRSQKMVNYVQKDNKIYFYSVMENSFFLAKKTVFTYKFHQLDLSKKKLKTLHTEKMYHAIVQLYIHEFENKIIWSINRGQYVDKVAEFDTQTSEFHFWWTPNSPLGKSYTIKYMNLTMRLAKNVLKIDSKHEGLWMGQGLPFEYITRSGRIFQTHPHENQLQILEVDASTGIRKIAATFATTYDSISFFEIDDDHIVVAITQQLEAHIDLFSWNLNDSSFNYFGRIANHSQGNPQILSHLDSSGRIFFEVKSNTKRLELYEADPLNESIILLNDYPLLEHSFPRDSISFNDEASGTPTRVLGIDFNNNLKVLRVIE